MHATVPKQSHVVPGRRIKVGFECYYDARKRLGKYMFEYNVI